MSGNGSGREPSGWLFNEKPRERRTPPTRRPFSLRNRSIYWWLNVIFVVVLLGMIFGAAAQPWFFVVAIVWMGLGVFVTVRARRNQPPPPRLFDDESGDSRNNG
ncbi:hypothetical protein [Glaciihabitans sp. UYNi722]|uniref:hypothetical protein n=1 Tax=Glaciihabitans sp. UYNi722 TaxID=3156344 RepID=UPI00339B70FE